jgi:hypothetical protein
MNQVQASPGERNRLECHTDARCRSISSQLFFFKLCQLTRNVHHTCLFHSPKFEATELPKVVLIRVERSGTRIQ